MSIFTLTKSSPAIKNPGHLSKLADERSGSLCLRPALDQGFRVVLDQLRSHLLKPLQLFPALLHLLLRHPSLCFCALDSSRQLVNLFFRCFNERTIHGLLLARLISKIGFRVCQLFLSGSFPLFRTGKRRSSGVSIFYRLR